MSFTYDHLSEWYGWLCCARGKMVEVSPPYAPHLSKIQSDEVRIAFKLLSPKGYSDEQISAAIEHVHATCKYDPTKGVAQYIIDAIADLGAAQGEAFHASAADLPAGYELQVLPAGNGGALPAGGTEPTGGNSVKALLSGGALEGDVNELLADIALVYWDWENLSPSTPPEPIKSRVNNAATCRQCFAAKTSFEELAADRAFTSFPAEQWWLRIGEELRSQGDLSQLFGTIGIFDRCKPIWRPKTVRSRGRSHQAQSTSVARPTAADPFEGRIPA